MNRTVQEHLQKLEQKLTEISGRIMVEQDKSARNQLETELRAVESAIAYYRSALEIELRVFAATTGLNSRESTR